jgi:hypothetical protein
MKPAFQSWCGLYHIFYAGLGGFLLNHRHLGGLNIGHHTTAAKLSKVAKLGTIAQSNLYLRLTVVLLLFLALVRAIQILQALGRAIFSAVILTWGDHWTLLAQVRDEFLLLSHITEVNGLLILFGCLAARVLTYSIVA